jgi:hypothetical protein
MLFARYYEDNPVKKDEMGWAFSTPERNYK